MSKFSEYMNQKVNEFHQARQVRRSETERDAALLPPDLTGLVYLACRDEAARVRARITTLEVAIEKLRPRLAAARERERAARVPIYRPARRRRHDILFGETDSQPAGKMESSGNGVRGEAAIEIHKDQVQPLQRLLRAYEFEITARQQELNELRKIAEAASEGSITLIHRLSAKWSSRLEVGLGMEGVRARLVPKAVWVDAAGHPLPPEAIRDGYPDLPAAGSGHVQDRGLMVIG